MNGHRAKTAKSQEASSVSMDEGQEEESKEPTLASGVQEMKEKALTKHDTKKSWTLNAHCAQMTKSEEESLVSPNRE